MEGGTWLYASIDGFRREAFAAGKGGVIGMDEDGLGWRACWESREDKNDGGGV